ARELEQSLGRHATDVQAVAAERVALDQRDVGAETCGCDRGDETRGPGADYDEVIALARLGLLVAGRHHEATPPRIVLRARIARAGARARHLSHRVSRCRDAPREPGSRVE